MSIHILEVEADLLDALSDEADLCRAETANDIADLLDKARAEILALTKERDEARKRVCELVSTLANLEGDAQALAANAVESAQRERDAARQEARALAQHLSGAMKDLAAIESGYPEIFVSKLTESPRWEEAQALIRKYLAASAPGQDKSP